MVTVLASVGSVVDESPAKLGLTKKHKSPASKVHVGGLKLRAGTVPWRYATATSAASSETEAVEVLLIEGVNTPGGWTFPAGSLDPGEDVAACSARETEEETGVVGELGCWLGCFERRKKNEVGGKRSYYFLLQVTDVHDAESEYWQDPDTCWEGDGLRRKRWCSPMEAFPLLKKDGGSILQAFLDVPSEMRVNKKWRPPVQDIAARSVLFLGDLSLIHEHCASHARILCAGSLLIADMDATCFTPEHKFAINAAALWEADAIFVCTDPAVAAVASSLDPCLLDPHSDRVLALETTSRAEEETEAGVKALAEACHRIDAFLAERGWVLGNTSC